MMSKVEHVSIKLQTTSSRREASVLNRDQDYLKVNRSTHIEHRLRLDLYGGNGFLLSEKM